LKDDRSTGELVSVVVPAYNAAAFIAETLESALAQSHRALEVIVVDDGSTDSTPQVVEAFASRDPRVRLLRQRNRGVAAARNLGIAEARGALIAPLDADDLWHPEKIARQVAAMRAAGPRVGMIYTWSSLIDEHSRVFPRAAHAALYEGDVFPYFVVYNFVGNASAPLIRRDCVRAVGGYDSGLRARGGEGCEDLMLYLRIAERYEVALVPELLVGYRLTSSNMSNDRRRMRRGRELVLETVRARHPDLPQRLYRWSRSFDCIYLGRRCLRRGRPTIALWLFVCALAHDPAAVLEPPLWRAVGRVVGRFVSDADPTRAGDKAPGFPDSSSRSSTIAHREIHVFSRRRQAFLKSLIRHAHDRQVETPQIGLTVDLAARKPEVTAQAELVPGRTEHV
jgi:glycosyltransferase involved in cell wall biosynthesis